MNEIRRCNWQGWSLYCPQQCCQFMIQHIMVRHSKLQKQVLALYRQFLRAAQDKPGFIPRIRDEFRTNATIKKTDVMHIEYLYRRAQRQLELLKDANTKQLGSFSKSKEDSWPLCWSCNLYCFVILFMGNHLLASAFIKSQDQQGSHYSQGCLRHGCMF